MSQPLVSIVIPAYNEAERLGSTLERVTSFFASREVDFEVIVVSDGSTDETASVARAGGDAITLIELPENRGKGAAVRTGVLRGRGEVVLFTDADLSTPIEQWVPIHAKLGEGYDVVVGSRALASSQIEVRQPWYRERMGKIFNWILRRILPLELKDTQCGFKLFDAAAAKRLFGAARIDGFAFDAEILYLAKRFGYRVAELPVPWFDSVPSRVHAVWHSAQMLKDLVRIRLLDAARSYDPSRAELSKAPFESDAGVSQNDAGPRRN
jgi:dolichyl-phosphate beta-glucosyltransferase